MKQCSKCKEDKSPECFSKWKRGKDGLYPHCKPCRAEARRTSREKDNEYRKTWSKDNPDKVRASYYRYYEKNKHIYIKNSAKRRATLKMQTPDLTTEEISRLNYIYWLRKDLETVSGEFYDVDHVHPISKGGLHHPDNLQVLPRDLNRSKGAKVI